MSQKISPQATASRGGGDVHNSTSQVKHVACCSDPKGSEGPSGPQPVTHVVPEPDAATAATAAGCRSVRRTSPVAATHTRAVLSWRQAAAAAPNPTPRTCLGASHPDPQDLFAQVTAGLNGGRAGGGALPRGGCPEVQICQPETKKQVPLGVLRPQKSRPVATDGLDQPKDMQNNSFS